MVLIPGKGKPNKRAFYDNSKISTASGRFLPTTASCEDFIISDISSNLEADTNQCFKNATFIFIYPSKKRPTIMTSSLPTPRAILTSLLTSLTNIPTPPIQPPANEPYSREDVRSSNPLKNLSPSQRALLTTLHVIFPPPMLLQALDLLDRRLVTRVILQDLTENETGEREEEVERLMPPQAHVHLASEIETSGEGKRKPNTVYLVRSSQPQKSRFNASSSTSTPGTIYTVHLEAWNCSCAAFAFSAFPGGSSGSGSSWKMDDESEGEDGGDGEREREFGGLCADENVPNCKHLVACLLGERWESVLGEYVKERVVAREEMAGFGSEC